MPNLSLSLEPVQGRAGRPRSLSDSYLTREVLCLPYLALPVPQEERRVLLCLSCLLVLARRLVGPRKAASLSLGLGRHPAPAPNPWDKLPPTCSPLGYRGLG